MRSIQRPLFTTFFAFAIASCGSPSLPEPIKVLENPATGERARFFEEIPYKVPADYDEAKHLREWTKEQNDAGFTREIVPADDREALAELRRKNREAAKK